MRGERPESPAPQAGAAVLSPGDLEEGFERESLALLRERARFILRAASVLYPSFWFLDLLVEPGNAWFSLGVRLIVVLIYGVVLALLRTDWGGRRVALLMELSTFASAAGVSLISARLGGFSSDYYVGNMIIIFVAGFFLPWRLRYIVVACVSILAFHFVVNAAVSGVDSRAISPMFFLAGASAFACLATVASERSRRAEYTLRRRIEKAHEELKKLDEAKTRFFANVSHELRTPLTMLLGPVDTLLQRSDETDPQRPLYEAMRANARRLLRQVNALLEVAKVDADRLRLELEDARLDEVLGQLVEAARPAAQHKGVELRWEVAGPIEARFDREKLEIVAANLLGNALKFTPGGGSVTVRAWADPGAGRVGFEVRDTGPGIPADELDKIFERFHQVDDSASREQEGTGLGLSLARELVQLHGGTIRCESEPAAGARFVVELPVQPPERVDRRRTPRRKADRFAAERERALAAQALERARRTETLFADVGRAALATRRLEPREAPPDAPRLLLVEDNPDLRAFVAHELSSDYRVDTARDGVEGLEAARRLRPDLIVTDVMMPRMDGRELCRRLKADPELQTIPVIVVTARAGAEAAAEGLEVGADDYVTKPFDMRELRARIHAHLRARLLERKLRERDSRLAAIGRMASAIVHDLKNPLASVVGYAELARMSALEGETSEVVAEELEPVVDEAQRLRRMIQEILDFARGERVELSPEPTPIGPWLEGVLQPLAQDFERAGMRLEYHSELGDDVVTDIDRDRLHRVIENIVTNAREALAQPGQQGKRRTLWVRLWAEGTSVLMRFADNGPGIPEQLAGRLFEVFATAGKRHGTGLGLATARQLVEAHGGTITAEARGAEGGAVFTIRLPLPVPGHRARTRAAGSTGRTR